MWIVDAHRDNGKRFVVQSDEKLTAFLELERATRESLLCYIGRFGARSVAGRVHRFADPVDQFWRRILTGKVKIAGTKSKRFQGKNDRFLLPAGNHLQSSDAITGRAFEPSRLQKRFGKTALKIHAIVFCNRISRVCKQRRTSANIGESVLIYVLTLPFLKPVKRCATPRKNVPGGNGADGSRAT